MRQLLGLIALLVVASLCASSAQAGREFDDADNQHLFASSSACVTAAPLTVFMQFRSDDATVNQYLWAVSDGTSDTESFQLQARGGNTDDPVWFLTTHGASYSLTEIKGYSAGTWHSVSASALSATEETIFLDGAEGTDYHADSYVPTGIDRTEIGRSPSGSYYFSGAIGPVAVWDVALSDAEHGALRSGAFAPYIRPDSLVSLWWMEAVSDDIEGDVVGGITLDVQGSAGKPSQCGIKPLGPRPGAQQ